MSTLAPFISRMATKVASSCASRRNDSSIRQGSWAGTRGGMLLARAERSINDSGTREMWRI
jgi:hypothetical protein